MFQLVPKNATTVRAPAQPPEARTQMVVTPGEGGYWSTATTTRAALIKLDQYFEGEKRVNSWAADEPTLLILDGARCNVKAAAQYWQ